MELSFNDKVEIFDIRDIKNSFIYGKKRNVVIFEYFSIFNESFLYDIIRDKNFDFQLKIKKEKLSNVKDEIFNNQYINLNDLFQEKQKDFAININDEYRNKIKEKSISKEEIYNFISEEKGELFIYRHYLIINIDNKLNIEEIIYDFIYDICHKDLIIRRLNTQDLENYLYSDLNYPYTIKNKGQLIKNNIENKKVNKKTFNLLSTEFVVEKIVNFIRKIVLLIDNSFFQGKIENIGGFIPELFEQNIYKGDNYLQIGDNYKGGIIIKGIPTDDFNILKVLFFNLDNNDSININIYPQKKHNIKDGKIEKGISKYITDKKVEEDIYSYLQLIINFNETNNILLDKRIQTFQLNIGTDFYCQRIVNNMSSYITTIIGSGKNELNLVKGYGSERLKDNLIF